MESQNPNDVYIKESYNPYNQYDVYAYTYAYPYAYTYVQGPYMRKRDDTKYNELEVTKAAQEALEVVESLM